MRRGRFASALLLAFASSQVGCSSSEESGAPAVQTGTDPFCSTRPKLQFCEDFDQGELPGRFASQDASGGSLQLVDTRAASVPRSLLVASNGNGPAVVKQTFAEGSKFRLFMLVEIEEQPHVNGDPSAFAEVGALDFTTPSGPYRLGFAVAGDGSWFAFETVGGATRRIATTAPVTTGDWTSVRFDVDLIKDGESTVFVRFGDESVVPHTAITPPVTTAAPTVSLGIAATNMGAWSLGVDNVTFQVD